VLETVFGFSIILQLENAAQPSDLSARLGMKFRPGYSSQHDVLRHRWVAGRLRLRRALGRCRQAALVGAQSV
jgi:hypothetical protein